MNTIGTVLKALPAQTRSAFAVDARIGLTRAGQKTMAPKYLYDPLGSALFEAITLLPEYGLWRAERQLIELNSEYIARLTQATSVLELGSGSANKTLPILQALLHQQPVNYCTVDISGAAIEMTRRALHGVANLSVYGIEDDYLSGLDTALHQRSAGERVLVLFLGSSLGNFDDASSRLFLRRVRAALRPGDALLLGADLIKPVGPLLLAYDDPLGVTAAFNLNLLTRMNRELEANFAVRQFTHRAHFNSKTHSVEMHLESCCDQEVLFPLDRFAVKLRAGETIHTESSHKYSLEELALLIEASGLHLAKSFLNEPWQFVSCLCTVS